MTLVGMAVVAFRLAAIARQDVAASVKSDPAHVIVLAILALACLALAAWMGFRTVRGPQPPSA
ncbi:MAG: hypothetical protein ACR2FO_06575 [Actinomycetota bacterium]